MPSYQVSVCIVTYKPNKEELLKTLNSVLMQVGVDLQIVVTDDGSPENFFDEIKKKMKDTSFHNYQLVTNPENQGTVKNYYKGLLQCTNEWIKVISPGDFLFSRTTLHDWIQSTEKAGNYWSFGDVVCYNKQPNKVIKVVSRKAHPQYVKPYIKRDIETCVYHYLVNNDIALGAAIICKRIETIEYLKEIVGKVIYAEDNIFRIMMADGKCPYYFTEEVMYYESSAGISTRGDYIWKQRLKKDWDKTDEIINCRHNKNITLINNLMKVKKIQATDNKLLKMLRYLSIKYWLKMRIKYLIYPRKTRVKQINMKYFVSF